MPQIESVAASTTPATAGGMDWLTFTTNVLTFISSLVASLAWPAVAIILLILLRPQLASLARRLEKLTLPGGASAEFSKQLDEARKATEEIKEADSSAAASPPSPTLTEPDDPYLELANKFPEAAIMQSYKEIEAALASFREAFPKLPRTDVQLMHELTRSQLIDPEIMPLFHRVRNLRNAAVHAGGEAITRGEALEYRSICQFLLTRIKEAMDRLKDANPEWNTKY